jgi:hypothetical protein
VASAAIAALSSHAGAAEFERLPNVAAVRMTGEIVPGDAKAFGRFMRKLDGRGDKIETLSLNSPGGDLRTSLDIGEEVRSRGLRTVVGEGGWCMSGCVIVFAFGVERVVYPTARLGVHSAQSHSGIGREDDGTKAATINLARRMKELGTPYSVIGKLIATPGADITILDEKDITAWNVRVVGEGSYQPLTVPERLLEFARQYPGSTLLFVALIFAVHRLDRRQDRKKRERDEFQDR